MSARARKRSALYTMSRTKRRALVLTMQVVMTAYVLGLAIGGGGSRWGLLITVTVLQVLYLALFFWIIRPISSEISERKASELDER